MTDLRKPIRRALISVYDKTGLEDLARGLDAAGVSIVSTGSTAARIADLGIEVTPVEQVTGFPECLDGRVKTLHPFVHAGILADLRLESHAGFLTEQGIQPFDLVVVNLYPFAATVASGAAPDDIVEQIDIGGPAMVRSAAKNHPSVAVCVSPAAYQALLTALGAGGTTLEQRKRLAAAAYAHTAAYDVAVANWFATRYAYADLEEAEGVLSESYGSSAGEFGVFFGQTFTRSDVLRYGENSHQGAASYIADAATATGAPAAAVGIAGAQQLHGKAMSFNNFVDGDAARRAAFDHAGPAVAIIKHANPCGIAVGESIAAAHAAAHACDPVSAFGGVIAANREVDAEMARQVAEVFTEVIIAPGFTAEALEVLTAKKNLRVLVAPAPEVAAGVETRPVSGGVLVQQSDAIDAVQRDESGEVSGGDAVDTWTLVAGEAADPATLASLEFAWRAVRAVKSNAILLARDGASVGVGMGQVNRVDSCRLAVERAGAERARGAVAASDAFFPFADGLQVLLDAGVAAVVAPGGSVRDAEVIAAAEAAGVALYFTGTRHFAH
ncbi:bifunctional phosphoribosylaminoimidazolecarboxamide formyltransferase/IMP cyclohydrolase [Micrococcales bacterium 31B]|nr:bifunctional phosphoribosylaminoimidazolecarboxamide formyltransferase/IMP cyclohydrolase [Micrococcales bacterium 31B]